MKIHKTLALGTAAAVAGLTLAAGPADAKTKKTTMPKQSCLTALTEAEAIGSNMSTMIGSVETFLQAEHDTAIANNDGTEMGLIRVIQDLTAATSTLGDTASSLAPELKDHVAAFNAAKTQCRAGR